MKWRFVIGLLVIIALGVLPIALTVLPRMLEGRPRPHCLSNLRQIGAGIQMYCADFEGHFPPSLDALYPDYVPEPMVFICGWSKDRKPYDPKRRRPFVPSDGSYEYVQPPLPLDEIKTPWHIVVAFDRTGNHPDGANVLMADGHVEARENFVYRQQAQQKSEVQADAEEEQKKSGP